MSKHQEKRYGDRPDVDYVPPLRKSETPSVFLQGNLVEPRKTVDINKGAHSSFLVEPDQEERARALAEQEQKLANLRKQLTSVDSNLGFKRAELKGATGTFVHPIESEIARLMQQRETLVEEIYRWESRDE